MSTFATQAAGSAKAWKASTDLLPDAARAGAPYSGCPDGRVSSLCLPPEFAVLNLLPYTRDVGLDRFQAFDIRWHDGAPAGPSNHLLSSQVQCVNALGPMVADAGRIMAVFGSVLGIVEPLPFDPASKRPDDLVVFEWMGGEDYLGERSSGRARRGDRTTSADAALRYRTKSGTEIALVEWKYTERYDGSDLKGGTHTLADRLDRYRKWSNGGEPLITSMIPYEDLFVEPFYQLFRQQVLAEEMEAAKELGADCVRVVYAAPSANLALRESLSRESHRAPGLELTDVWQAALRRPDRFVPLDTAVFVSEEGSGSDFADRYHHMLDITS